jgi:hypothetical protein
MNRSGWSSTKCARVWQKSGGRAGHSIEAFFCLDFFVTFFIKKKSQATGSYKSAPLLEREYLPIIIMLIINTLN